MTSTTTNHPQLFEGVPTGAVQEEGRIIVIGAGPAGLTAARVLKKQGRDVLVLEGRDRIGGRLNTINLGGGKVDEGANWVHGVPANPLYHLLKDAGFDVFEDEVLEPFRLTIYDKATGRLRNSLRCAYLLWRAERAMTRFSNDSLTTQHAEPNLAARIDKETLKIKGTANQRIFKFGLRTVIDLIYAEKSELLHANSMVINPDYLDDNVDYVMPGGYSLLIERLAEGLDIRLDTRVEKVTYDETGVEVIAGKESYRASHVIVTVPLGVLKAGTISFSPPLPDVKQEAIDNLGFGNVEKIIFKFDDAFWRTSPDRGRTILYISETIGDFPAFTDISKKAGVPMLCAFLSGDQAREMAEDAEPFIDKALGILKELFPDDYQAPTAVHVSNWQKDPFAYGSYSTPTVTTRAENYDQLAEPVAGRLLFAGEATYRARAGFVEGAMGSGLREARRILGEAVDLSLRR